MELKTPLESETERELTEIGLELGSREYIVEQNSEVMFYRKSARTKSGFTLQYILFSPDCEAPESAHVEEQLKTTHPGEIANQLIANKSYGFEQLYVLFANESPLISIILEQNGEISAECYTDEYLEYKTSGKLPHLMPSKPAEIRGESENDDNIIVIPERSLDIKIINEIESLSGEEIDASKIATLVASLMRNI